MSKNANEIVFKKYDDDLVEFARSLIRIRSYSDQEGDLARHIARKMEDLDYDEVFIDTTGNVVGRIGHGPRTVLFDSHMDTVEVNDEPDWHLPPFAAEIEDGRVYGRGSVDMKSSIAASVYAGAVAKELGLDSGKTIYVTATVCEEYCDGESLGMFFKEHGLKPDFVVICEPSDNLIVLGHKGKAQMVIRTHGVSAHGSAPEKGVNAVYEMAGIIERVEKLNESLATSGSPHGTIVLSDISCVSASLNAVPSECSIYLDRRMALGETEEDIRHEMEDLVREKKPRGRSGHSEGRAGKERTFVMTPSTWHGKSTPNTNLPRPAKGLTRKLSATPPIDTISGISARTRSHRSAWGSPPSASDQGNTSLPT